MHGTVCKCMCEYRCVCFDQMNADNGVGWVMRGVFMAIIEKCKQIHVRMNDCVRVCASDCVVGDLFFHFVHNVEAVIEKMKK